MTCPLNRICLGRRALENMTCRCEQVALSKTSVRVYSSAKVGTIAACNAHSLLISLSPCLPAIAQKEMRNDT